jgi:hypothetical protein
MALKDFCQSSQPQVEQFRRLLVVRLLLFCALQQSIDGGISLKNKRVFDVKLAGRWTMFTSSFIFSVDTSRFQLSEDFSFSCESTSKPLSRATVDSSSFTLPSLSLQH